MNLTVAVRGLLIAVSSLISALLMIATPVYAQTNAAAPKKVVVMLDWFINPDHGPIIHALERGTFAKYGLDVELIEPANPNDPVKLVAAREADIAVSYQPQVAVFRDGGLPIKRFATLVATPLNSVVMLNDSPIREVADLKGKTIGFSVAGYEDAILGSMLETYGLTLEDVRLVNVNFALTSSLLTRKVDAVVGAFRNFELNQLLLHNARGRAFFPEEHGVPAYDELVFVARDDTLEQPWLGQFVAALEESTVHLINHSHEAWLNFANHKEGLNTRLNRMAWHATVPRFALRPRALDHARYDTFAQFLKRRGLLKRTLRASDYAVELGK